MMTSAQVVETSDTTTDNSPSQDYTLPDDQTTLLQRENPNKLQFIISSSLIPNIGDKEIGKGAKK